MKDKEKQIVEMARTIECLDMPMTCFSDCRECEYIKERDNNWFCQELKIAKELYNAGYRKITDSVVLSREEYTNYMVEYMGVKEIKDRVSKETAEKILNKLYCTPKEQVENKIKELARFIGVEIKE